MAAILKDFKETAVYKNVTVQILESENGEVSAGWYRQPNTVKLDTLNGVEIAEDKANEA